MRHHFLYFSYLLSFLGIVIFSSLEAQVQFVENKGQWIEKVQYKADIPGGAFFAESTCFTFRFYDTEVLANSHAPASDYKIPDKIGIHAYKVHFVGAQTESILGEKKNETFFNYYLGNDETKWVDHALSYNKLNYNNIYPNINLKVYQKETSLKYDFKVFPGGNPTDILMQIEGIRNPKIKDGNLILLTSVNKIVEYAPYAYQLINGKLTEVSCQFSLSNNELSFDIDNYDTNHTLIIDPEMAFATYSGSNSDNWGFTATNDTEGNLIGGSVVFGNGYPTTIGAYDQLFNGGTCDVAITKFGADGSSNLFSTYIGAPGLEMPHSLICDSQDNIIVMGTTGSPSFPTTGGSYQSSFIGGDPYSFSGFFLNGSHEDGCDFFVSKFNPSGGMIASTFVGGSENDGLNTGDNLFYNYGDVYRGEVIADEDDNIYVASVTLSQDFPLQNPGQSTYEGIGTEGIAFELDPSLSNLLWASFVGGSYDDAAYSIQITSSGQKVVTGGTKSTNFPTTSETVSPTFHGVIDGFITIFSAAGNTVEAATTIGTSAYDQCYFVQLDILDNIFVVGQTEGDFQVVGSVYNNPNSGQFIQKYNSDLTTLEWSTTVGTGSGNIDISPSAFLVSDCDQIYLSGWGGSTNANNSPEAEFSTTIGLPITADAFQSTTDGSDFYLCVLSPDATDLAYATFFGGGTSNEHVDGGTSKFDKTGSVYQAVCAGCQGNSDFPTSPGAWSQTNNSTNCNLGVFKFDLNVIEANVEIEGPDDVCEGEVINLVNNSSGGDEFLWTFGDGNSSDQFDPEYQYNTNGEFIITLIVSSSQDCVDPDTTSVSITIIPGVSPSADIPDLICPGGTTQLQGYGSDNIFWVPDAALSNPDISNPTVTVDEESIFYLVDFNECETETLEVQVNFYEYNVGISEEETICVGNSAVLEATGGIGYNWTPTTGLNNPSIANPTASPSETTLYTVTITTPENCEVDQEVNINVIDDFPGGNIYPDINICINTSATLESLDGYNWSWTPSLTLNNPSLQNPTASPEVTTTYFVTIENACGEGVDQITVNVIIPNANAGDDGIICLNDKHPVWAEGGISYLWTPASYFDEYTQASTFVSPTESGLVTVAVTDEFGCTAYSQVYIEILPLPGVNAGQDPIADIGEVVELQGIAEGVTYWWTPSEGLSCGDCLNPTLQPTAEGWYTLHTVSEIGCESMDSSFVHLNFPIFVPNAFSPNQDGINEFFQAYGNNIDNFHLLIFDRWGTIIYESSDIDEKWDGSNRFGNYYVSNGTYNWLITYDHKLVQKELRGHVTIVR